MLKCTSSYPANTKDLNLFTIKDLKKKFNCEIGYSDHSLGIGAAISAVTLGATIIEKHFTLEKNKGVDGKFSIEKNEMQTLKKECTRSWQALGKVYYGPTKNERLYKKYKRSIYVSKLILKGEKFTNENLKIVRPSFGLHPKFYEDIIEKFQIQRLKWVHHLKKICKK